MNIDNIKAIINLSCPDQTKINLILNEIANDSNAMNYMWNIISSEREQNKQLLLDTNLELSRALVFIEKPKAVEKSWIIQNIKTHYEKWKHKITCCFHFDYLP